MSESDGTKIKKKKQKQIKLLGDFVSCTRCFASATLWLSVFLAFRVTSLIAV